MSLFNSIKNIFFEEDSGPSHSTGTPTPKPPSQMLRERNQVAAAPVIVPPSKAGLASVDEKVYKEFAESLNRAIESNNLPGFDFFEFNQLFNRFISAGKSEAEAIETALASAETMRVDKNMLISHYQHYEKVLRDQRIIFDRELKSFFDDNIGKPKEAQQKIQAEISEKENTIRQFTMDIENLKEKKKGLSVDVVKAEDQTKQVEASFNKAFNDISTNLQGIVNRLKQKQG